LVGYKAMPVSGRDVGVEDFHHPGEVEQAATEAIDFVDDNGVDLAPFDVGQQALQGRAVHRAAAIAAVIVVSWQAWLSLLALASRPIRVPILLGSGSHAQQPPQESSLAQHVAQPVADRVGWWEGVDQGCVERHGYWPPRIVEGQCRRGADTSRIPLGYLPGFLICEIRSATPRIHSSG
jgi:hypothetical protein